MNEKKPKQKKEETYKKILIGFIAVLLLVVIIAGVIIYKQNSNKEDENELPYTDLIKEISYNNVEKVEMTTGSTTVKVKLVNEEEEKTTIVPSTQSFMELIQQKVAEGNEIELVQKPRSVISQIPGYIFSILPTLIMLALLIMIFKMQGLGEKGKVYEAEDNKTKVTFDDIAGLDEEKEELVEIVDFLKKPERYVKMGAKHQEGYCYMVSQVLVKH